MKRLIFITLVTLLLAPALRAQEGALISRVLFRVGSSELDTAYDGNARTLEAFVRGMDALMRDPAVTVAAVLVETGASPEGGALLNDRLAMERARSIRAWILANIPLNASQVKAYSVGADWEGLWMRIWESDCPWRGEVLEAITASGVRMDASEATQRRCLNDLRAIDGSRAWAWMTENVFPDLRAGAGTIRCITIDNNDRTKDTVVVVHGYDGPDAEWYLDRAVQLAAAAATGNVMEATRPRPSGWRRDSLWKNPVVAVRMNLLTPLMSSGIEVPIGNRWSVAADWCWPWLWRQWGNRYYTPNKYCFEALGGYVEGRYWFGNDHLREAACRKYRLAGHSVGLIFSAGYYDIQYQWKGRQGEFGAIGIGYMYGLPLGRHGRIHLELEVAFGYMTTAYRSYEVHTPGGRLVGDWNDGTWKGPVPLKAAVNLVVPFFDNGIIKPAR